jgi:hypothetical protein
VHAGVCAGEHTPNRAVFIEYALRESLEIGDRHDWQTCAKGEALRHTRREPDPGEGTGAAAECNGGESGQAEARLGQHLIHHGQNHLCMTALKPPGTLQELRAQQQRNRATLGRSIDGEDSHGAAATCAAGARGAWRARKRRASPASCVTVITGSAARNVRP